MHRARRKSTPLLTQFVEPGSLQVVRAHDNPKLDIGLKCEKPRLGQRRDFRWVRQIDDEHSSPLTILLCEIDGLRFNGLQNPNQL